MMMFLVLTMAYRKRAMGYQDFIILEASGFTFHDREGA